MATVIRKFKVGLSKEDVQKIKDELNQIEVDEQLDETSENPVTNKAVTQAINGLNAAQNLLDIVGTDQDLEEYPTQNLLVNDKIKVLNDRAYDEQAAYYRWDGTQWKFIALEPVPKIEMDAVVTQGSDKFVSSGVVYNAIEELKNEIIADLEGDY